MPNIIVCVEQWMRCETVLKENGREAMHQARQVSCVNVGEERNIQNV
jgi:hypothetical protein